MAHYLAIVAYRCLVSGVPSGTLDVQVQWYDAENEATIRQLIEANPIHSYKNGDDETVSWELAEVFAIEPFAPTTSGDEVIGFIAETSELSDLA
jgi:hypothetical protein